jgi:ELWxxDGT repeat protein
VNGHELWKSNGTAAGTVLVKDLTPGPDGSNDGDPEEYLPGQMHEFTNINGILFFVAYQNYDLMLWKSNGTAAGTVAFQPLQRSGWDYARPQFSKVNNSVLYFNAVYPNYENLQYYLWRMDLNSTTPVVVKEFDLPEDHDLNQLMVTMHNKVFFNGLEVGGGGYKLFRSDGTTAGTVSIMDVYNASNSSNPSGFANINNLTVFTAQERQYDEGGIWRTDGTPTGTFRLHKAPGSVQALASTPTTAYFMSYESNFKYELWKTDGSLAGTAALKSFTRYDVENATTVNNLMFFSFYSDGKLWRTDGTAAGTILLADVHDIMQIYGGGSVLYFVVRTEANHIELWRSNGTTTGTFSIKQIATDTPPSPAWARQNFAYLNGILYFLANDLVHGFEVWRTNGTTAGTYMFADLNVSDNNNMGAFDFDIASLYTHQNYLYISARDNSGIWKLVRTNGSTAPTKVSDLFPVSNMVSSSDRLYLFATNSHTNPQAITHTLNLWVTDGTGPGTMKLSDEHLLQNLDYEVVNDVLYFSSELRYAEQHEGKLYRSDGTPCGTFSLATGVTGAAPMEALNNKLIFAALGPNVGVEPYAYNTANAPQSPCGATVAFMSSDSSPSTDQELTTWPNPFTADFTFKFAGAPEENVDVAVFSGTGFPVETFYALPANTEHALGKMWAPGLYIVKVNRGGKLTTHMVIKK